MENPLAFPWADTSALNLFKFLTISSKYYKMENYLAFQ